MLNLIPTNKKAFSVYQNTFPDHTLLVKLDYAPPHIVAIEWLYENDAELFTLACLKDHYEKDAVTLIMPYIPHARMDRVKNNGDIFTLKTFAKMINAMYFDRVYVRDPHSYVSTALLDRIKIESPISYIEMAIEEVAKAHNISKYEVVLFFPDEGAMKRYSEMFTSQYAYGIKQRDWETGKILDLKIIVPPRVELENKHILYIDDICSKGDTLYYSALALQQYGVGSISAYSTHLERTILQGRVFLHQSYQPIVERIFTTRSIFKESDLKSDTDNVITILKSMPINI